MAKLSDITAVHNGARFFNVDLHIHTHGASHDVKDTGMTPQAIVDSAIRQGIGVIAITDHNSDQNVKAAIDYAAAFQDKLLVLAGVEVTTAHGHLLVYFAPDKLEDLNTFLAKLDLEGPRGADNTHTAKSMASCIELAYAQGGICVAAHIDRTKTGFEMLQAGAQTWKKDIITSPGLYGIECDQPSALTWYSNEDSGGDVAADRNRLFNSRGLVGELSGRKHLAHLQGSDAHRLVDFETGNPDKSWTRIKMTDLNWEAFRTAMTDPTARVKPKAALPKAIPRVRGIVMNGGFLKGEIIHFSDNLNCFIGGRGTGKSTAIRALAYAFGLNDEFGDYENCPDSVMVVCEDASGVLYAYQRTRGGDVTVKAKEDQSFTDVPIDAFRIDYYGQGMLADVAKDPLNTPQLFQAFLDRHTSLRDLTESEETVVQQLRENAAHLIQLENGNAQLRHKKTALAEVEKKLKLAEEGQLREIVGVKSQITSERTIQTAIEEVVQEYERGLTLSTFERNYDALSESAGEGTQDPTSISILENIKTTLQRGSTYLQGKTTELNTELKSIASELTIASNKLRENHVRLENELAPKITALKEKGLTADLKEISLLLQQKGTLGREITAIEQKAPELKSYREERTRLRTELSRLRIAMSDRRKAQLESINRNLSKTIQDYTIFVRYDDAGILDEYLAYVQEKMVGSHFPQQRALQLCERITPSDLADWLLNNDTARIQAATELDAEWVSELVNKMRKWSAIYELQALSKQPKPIITVKTKTLPTKEIPVVQLSDGQRHTILLTMAMLAESNVPLVIDQPEDDLDNAFIFSSIVETLRSVKEKRQVILVTHNSNIAVLGDSELLLPMKRTDDHGEIEERGSIDKATTKALVQKILEGGSDAFNRRKEIYGH